MRHVSPYLVVSLVLASAACGLVGPDETRFQVEGRVTAADDGSPIAGASVRFIYCEVETPVSCNARTVANATTDEQGRYALSYVHPGQCEPRYFQLWVIAAGFQDGFVTSSDHPHITCTEGAQTIDVQLVAELE